VICQGEDVVVRWTSTATHDGPGLGVPPSGRRVTMRGITWIRVRGGKLIEGWQSSNIDEVVRGLTAVS
jgi:predicted ester cyclase